MRRWAWCPTLTFLHSTAWDARTTRSFFLPPIRRGRWDEQDRETGGTRDVGGTKGAGRGGRGTQAGWHMDVHVRQDECPAPNEMSLLLQEAPRQARCCCTVHQPPSKFTYLSTGGEEEKSLGQGMEKSQDVFWGRGGGNPFKAWPDLKNKTDLDGSQRALSNLQFFNQNKCQLTLSA